jgi:hypothetical protein
MGTRTMMRELDEIIARAESAPGEKEQPGCPRRMAACVAERSAGCASLYIVSGNFAVQRDLGDVQDSVSNSRRYRVEAKIAHTVRHGTLTDLPNGVLSSANAWKMP